MFKAKKVLCFAIAVAMAIPVSLSGYCASVKTQTKASAITTITVWDVGAPCNGQARVNKAINAYLAKKKENVRVNWQQIGWGSTIENKVNTMMNTGGNDCDILFTANWVNSYRSNANKGYFTNLNSFLKTKEGKKIVSILSPSFVKGSQIGGVSYALPTNKEKAHSWGFLVRTDLSKKYGLTAAKMKKIKTTKDLIPYFKKAKADGKTPLAIGGCDGPWHFLDWDMVSDDTVPIAFSYASSKTGKVIDPFVDAKSVKLFKEMKSYYDAGYVSRDAITKTAAEDELKTGKYFCGVDSLKPYKDKEFSAGAGYNYTQINITSPVESNRETTGAMMAINNFSSKKAAAKHALYLFYTDKTLLNLIVYGQNGKDYTLLKNGHAKVNAKSDFSNAGQGWTVGNQFNDLLSSTESNTKWKEFTAFNKKGKALPSLGFIFNDNKIGTQETACKNTINTYYKQLIAGAVVNVDSTISQMKKELAAEGESKLISAAQTQYNAFLKKKK